MLAVTYPREQKKKRPKKMVPETGPERWTRWQAQLDSGEVPTRAELARLEGVSRAAVTMGLRKLETNQTPEDG